LLHLENGLWQSGDGGTGADLLSIRGNAPNDIWVGASDGTALHWDGTQWVVVSTGLLDAVRHLVAAGPNDVWATSESFAQFSHWTGTWNPIPQQTNNMIQAGWADGAAVTLVGQGGTILHHSSP
jgi:hypothetical protein